MSPQVFLSLLLLYLSLSFSSVSSRLAPHYTPFKAKLPLDASSTLMYCDSIRITSESDTVHIDTSVTEVCGEHYKEYLYGGQYEADSFFIARQALEFAKTIQVKGDGNDVWIFDIDEVLLSNLGLKGWKIPEIYISNLTSTLKTPPALPASLWLYNELKALGFQLIILSADRLDNQRNSTTEQLLKAGYNSWTKLMLRGNYDMTTYDVLYKADIRARLVEEGYRIHGNVCSVWLGLWGPPMANRSFKLPNVMYSS
ncbi:hypothetical protein LUZ60_012558 [Juncus effusus]|nr:hypothetical protein LUZ60_012558 [Juncus effusus]